MANRVPFVWDGIEHWTGGELMETVALISDSDEADAFMAAYVEHTDGPEHAYGNIAYICSIIEDGDEVFETFQLADYLDKIPNWQSPRQWFSNSSLGVKVAA